MVHVVLLVLGLIIGSFLGALTYRLPRGISIAKGRSICPSCSYQIAWYDNIPVLSFLVLLGRCRNCHKSISFREPLIEISTTVVFVVVGLNVFSLIVACILITVFVVDLEHQIIPDEVVFLGLFIFLAFNILFVDSPVVFSYLFTGLVSANLLLILNLVTNGKGMGLGDVKLAILLGALSGNNFLVWLFFSFAAGAIIGIILIVFKKAGLKQKIAFGPFLIIGYVLTIYFAPAFTKLIGF